MRKKKILFIIGGIILVAVIVILNLTNKEGGKEVEVAIVEKGDIIAKVTASGELRAKSQIDISAETIGRIKKIFFQEGDYVNVDFREATDLTGTPVPLYTGYKETIIECSWDREARVKIKSDLPLACNVVSLVIDMEVR